MGFDGKEYQSRFDSLAAQGKDVHGEATLVRSFLPKSVLDAGCGTGRVARELATHGIDVVGVDVDHSMITEARRLEASLEWIEHDLATLRLERTFDVVLLAGNVPLFCPVDQRSALIGSCAAHIGDEGIMISGFQVGIDRGFGAFDLKEFDAACEASRLELVERFSTWDRQAFDEGLRYAVSVHARA